MGIWKRKKEKLQQPRGIARAALSGTSREELVREAIVSLARESLADRIGAWLGASKNEEGAKEGVFRGAVWDRDAEGTPREWTQLAPEFPLPQDLLRQGKSVEQEVEGTKGKPLLGPLAGLRRVLWTPVRCSGGLRGILLAGLRTAAGSLPREEMEAAAAEISLAMELEDRREQGRQAHADLAIVRRMSTELSEGKSPEFLLSALVEDCIENSRNSPGPRGAFAAIGRWRGRGEFLGGPVDAVEFWWKAGDETWTGAVESEPLAGIWREALECSRTTGRELNAPWSKMEIARAVAIPLQGQGEPLGVLLAGFEPGTASLGKLERLELRALLAASLLATLRQREREFLAGAEYQSLLEASKEALVVVKRNGSVLRKNQMAVTNFGEALGIGASAPFGEWMRARERAASEAWFRKLWDRQGAESPKPFETELRNGKRVEVRVAGTASQDAVILGLEASETAKPREESREAIELLTLVEWLDQGVVLFDDRERIRALNLKFAQLTGLGPEEADKLATLDGLIHRLAAGTGDPEGFEQRWRELARSEESGTREEVQLARPVSRVLERISRPIWDRGGKRLGRLELYRDLTAQRIFQARLLQTEKLAALGQMVSGVAHELSNPLTSISGYAQRLLLRTDLTGRSEEVHRIFSEAERANAILRQMLVSVRETPREPRPIALNQLVLRTVELQRMSMAAEKVHVDMDLDPLLPPVRADAGQLQQVLMNLINNARQALEGQGNGGTIRLRSERVGTQRVRLEVSDTGPGIPEEVQARIFDPFFTTKPEGVGTGLGLSIVLSIVREHHGQVYVQSTPGRGAKFVIEFPAAAEPGRARRYRGAQEGKAAHEDVELRGAAGEDLQPRVAEVSRRRALVVEDEPTVAQLIADVLRDNGFEVKVLLNGREAPEEASSAEFDLVICDVKMPGLDGPHFYRSLVKAGNPLQHKFLFVTGDVLAAQTRQFLEKNRLPHVAKPFRIEEFTEKVERVLAEAEHVGGTSAERKNAATQG
jgi:signal transduction histidine kinase/CheY-like chemotaxis protein